MQHGESSASVAMLSVRMMTHPDSPLKVRLEPGEETQTTQVRVQEPNRLEIREI